MEPASTIGLIERGGLIVASLLAIYFLCRVVVYLFTATMRERDRCEAEKKAMYEERIRELTELNQARLREASEITKAALALREVGEQFTQMTAPRADLR